MVEKNNLTKGLYLKSLLFVGVISVLFIFNSCKKETSPATVEVNHIGSSDTAKVVVPPGDGTSVTSTNTLKFMFGVNAFEWNFLNQSTINETNMGLIKSFSCVRHYMDWDKLE